jgi:hypothetical protein
MPIAHLVRRQAPSGSGPQRVGWPAESIADEPSPAWVWPGAKEEAKTLVRRGDEALSRGSIEAARSIYEYAATEMRWSPAALAVAATYDPHELAHTAPLVRADPEQAHWWYLRAQDLAIARIRFHLQRLGAPRARSSALP